MNDILVLVLIESDRKMEGFQIATTMQRGEGRETITLTKWKKSSVSKKTAARAKRMASCGFTSINGGYASCYPHKNG